MASRKGAYFTNQNGYCRLVVYFFCCIMMTCYDIMAFPGWGIGHFLLFCSVVLYIYLTYVLYWEKRPFLASLRAVVKTLLINS